MTSPYLNRALRTYPEATYDIAMAAGRDAGNKSMRKGGRDHWSQEDWDAAERTFKVLKTP